MINFTDGTKTIDIFNFNDWCHMYNLHWNAKELLGHHRFWLQYGEQKQGSSFKTYGKIESYLNQFIIRLGSRYRKHTVPTWSISQMVQKASIFLTSMAGVTCTTFIEMPKNWLATIDFGYNMENRNRDQVSKPMARLNRILTSLSSGWDQGTENIPFQHDQFHRWYKKHRYF